MKKNIFLRYFSIVFLCMVICLACHKDKKPSVSGGGKGGKAVLKLSPEAHGTYVDTCKYYIKYGTLDDPGNGIFDDSAVCILNDTIPVATFTNLTIGNYYVMAIGLHVGYSPPNVKGGLAIIISQEDTIKVVTQLGVY